jgi:hypothetical protein
MNARVSDPGVHVSPVCESLLLPLRKSCNPHPPRCLIGRRPTKPSSGDKSNPKDAILIARLAGPSAVANPSVPMPCGHGFLFWVLAVLR